MTENIALEKPILEIDVWENHSVITDGNSLHYKKRSEYAAAKFPCYCTVDLQNIHSLKRVRLLLWDNDNRKYKYRFLTSTDFVEGYKVEITPISRFIHFFSRILIGFCIYQFIAAFRRHGKR